MVKRAVQTEFLQLNEPYVVEKPTEQTKDCCANCGYLSEQQYCERYELSLVGEKLEQCTCECFTLRSDKNADV